MITPTQRARVVIRHAWLAGGGEPITRADVLATLDGRGGTNVPPAVTPDPDPVIPDPTPDHPPITPAQAPDDVVSLADAATRLGVSVGTVRRYCAPSSGRLIRQADGVTLASLEAAAAGR